MNSMTGSAGPTGSMKRDIIPKGYKKGRLSNFTPEQMQLFRELFSNVSPDSYLARLASGDEELFDEMEAPALRQHSALQGNLASRFSGMGMGARKSSGFQNEATAAASNFAQELQSRRQSLQQNAIKELMGLSSDLLGQRPYENLITPKQQKEKGGGWGGAIGAGLGGIGGFLAGGPVGAATGASIGYKAGSSF